MSGHDWDVDDGIAYEVASEMISYLQGSSARAFLAAEDSGDKNQLKEMETLCEELNSLKRSLRPSDRDGVEAALKKWGPVVRAGGFDAKFND